MANHLIVIPGFGMKGADLGPVQNVPGFVHPVSLDPDWNGCHDLSSVADKLADEINRLYAQAALPRKVVVYGFSLGGDLLMEMVNRNLLDLGADSYLILADPNVNTGTCFISGLAVKSPDLQTFLNAITAHANGPGTMQHGRWMIYQGNVANNTNQQHWANLQGIAQSVLSTVDQRFADFKSIVGAAGETPKGAQVQILLSEESEEALAAVSPSYRFFWIVCPPKLHHFDLADGGTIARYAGDALRKITG